MTELIRVPSKPFYEWLDKIADNEQTTRDSFEKAVSLARKEKFTDLEIALLMKDYLKDKISRTTLWRWTKSLEPKEEIEDCTSESISLEQNDDNSDPEERPTEPEEDPKEIENQFLKEKVTELEDALRKTEQFKPATALEQLPEVIEAADKEDKRVHSWLKNSADGIGTFYYDTYGIDLFKNRELTQLKNSGVKVFKRLYFEV